MNKLASLLIAAALTMAPIMAQLAVHDQSKLLGFDANLTHILPIPYADPLYGAQLRLSGQWWLDQGEEQAASLLLSSEHNFTLPLDNNRDVGLTTKLLPFIYLGQVDLGSNFDIQWDLLKSSSVHMMFAVKWLGVENLLLPFKAASWHELSLRLLNQISLSLFWNSSHFIRFTAAPFFFIPALSLQNFGKSGSSGYSVSVSSTGNFYGEIAVYSQLDKSFANAKVKNRPYLGIFLGLQLYHPNLRWINDLPPGVDWSQGINIAQLQLGMRTWLPPPTSAFKKL